jgi:regulator of cell morphogenesis and NO signaling
MLNFNPVNFNEMNPSELCEYIAKRHHEYVREEFGKISDHLKTALNVDVNSAPELRAIVKLFHELQEELEQHFNKEEEILFPLIQQLVISEGTERGKRNLSVSIIDKPLEEMNKDHKKIEGILSEIRRQSHDYFLDPMSSPTHKLCFNELFALEDDLHKQFYLEENILTRKLITWEQTIIS